MENEEYTRLINYYSFEYNIKVPESRREQIIDFYYQIQEMIGTETNSFEIFIKELLIEDILSQKYPTMNLYENIFTPMGQN